jgi:hypothetical protein
VGEGGEIEQSEMKPGEGSLSAETNPSSGVDCVHATFSHKGRRK